MTKKTYKATVTIHKVYEFDFDADQFDIDESESETSTEISDAVKAGIEEVVLEMLAWEHIPESLMPEGKPKDWIYIT